MPPSPRSTQKGVPEYWGRRSAMSRRRKGSRYRNPTGPFLPGEGNAQDGAAIRLAPAASGQYDKRPREMFRRRQALRGG